MSEVIPEKGVCRIVFESTDNDVDYGLDVDDESESDQSGTSNSEEDKIHLEYRCSHINYYCQEFNERKKNNCSSESEHDDEGSKLSTTYQYDDKEQRKKFQNVPDLSNMLPKELSNLLENDKNTIRKSFSHQPQNGPFKNVEMTDLEIQNNNLINSQSYKEMTEAVRRLTEVLILPISQSKFKESYVANQKKSNVQQRKNTLDTILMQQTSSIKNTDDLKILYPPSSLGCFDSNNGENSLRTHLVQKHNSATVLHAAECQPISMFEAEASHIENDNNEFEYEKGSDDTMDFYMAVEALNLLKNKGKINSDSFDGFKETLQTIDAASKISDSPLKVVNETSLPDVLTETYSYIDPIRSCSKTEETKRYHLFDSTLEITDCSTGAIIPFESFYQNNTDFLKADANKFSNLNENRNEIQTDKNMIPSKLTQLSDTVVCVKVPLHESILSDRDQKQESIIDGLDCRYSEHQVEVGNNNAPDLKDTSLQISKTCSSSLPEIKIRKLSAFKTKSTLTKKRSKKTKINSKDQPVVLQPTEYPNASTFWDKKTESHTNYFKSPRIFGTKKNYLEPKIQDYNEQLEEMKKILEEWRSGQTLKTSNSAPELSITLKSNVNSMNEACTISENNLKFPKSSAEFANEVFLPDSSKINQFVAKPGYKQKEENENGNLDNFQNSPETSNFQLLDEKQLITDKLPPDLDLENIKTPLDAFHLYINDGMINRIVKYTNKKLQGSSEKVPVLGYKKATHLIELRAFIGILLISAALKQNNVKVAELWSECFGAGIYRATLQEGRFYIFLSNLSFGDVISTNKKSQKDEIGDPWDEYLKNCKRYPIPKVSVNDTQNHSNDEDPKQNFTTFRKTTNLSLSALFSMLDTAAIRGTAFLQKGNPYSRTCLRTFFKQVGMALVKQQLEDKLLRPTISNSMRELIERILSKKCKNTYNKILLPVADQTLEKHKRCQLCSWNKDRKTRHKCICCQKKMCKQHRAQVCTECIQSI